MEAAQRMNHITAKRRWSVVAVLCAMALAVIDAGIVNVALPTLGRTFEAAPATAMAVVSTYQLALLIGLLPCAQIAERVGQRNVFVGGLIAFTLASVGCAAAPSIAVLIVFRFVEGLGAAAIMSLGIALLRAALGTDRLAAIIGWNALTVAICSAAGPAIGALLLSLGSWRWLFLAGLPLSGIALVAARALPALDRRRGRIDRRGISLHALAAALVFVGFKMLIDQPLFALALLSGGGICLAMLARRDLHDSRSVVPFDLLANSSFRRSVVASICCFTAQSAGIVVLPFQVEYSLGRDPLIAGLVLASWPIGVAATSAAANRYWRTQDTSGQCAAGAGLLMAGLLIGAALPSELGVWPLAGAAALCGTGFGLFQLANNRNLFLTAPAERSAAAGGMQGTARLAGQTAGTLLAALVFASILPIEAAPRIGFAIASAFAFLAALVSGSTARAQFRAQGLRVL